MGCSIPSGFHSTMSLFGRKHASNENKTKLERKLYLARESPEPTFDLSECSLKNVPSGIYSLCKVFRKEVLNLEQNLLTDLEDGGNISDLCLLKILNINKNKFSKITNEINLLINLKELYLSSNQLKQLPDSVGDLRQLQILDVSNNNLKSVPESLGNLKRLRKLYLNGNNNLKILCKEICKASNLQIIEIDRENIIYPSYEVTSIGTSNIMKYLCEELGIDYVPPLDDLDNDSIDGTPYTVLSPAEIDKTFKGQFSNWEMEDENLHRMEIELHEASKRQKEKFLLEFTQEQMKLDNELNKFQSVRDGERMKLIKQIQDEENATQNVVAKLLEINVNNPHRLQQFIEHDEKEYDRLLEMCRVNYSNLKKNDTLKAMQSLLEEECSYERSLKSYGDSQSEVKTSFLIQELDSKEQLDSMLKLRGEMQSELVEKLLKDEDLQKAAVGALLEKCDARTWGLVQEISLVEANLAKLSAIELDRRKLQFDDNMDTLADQRIKLTFLLVDLLQQQESRRSQLLDTLQAMEREKKTSSDFWLIRYQQLLDSVPDVVVSTQKTLDPIFANYLLSEGVIHCLPFLVQWVSNRHDLASLTDEMLQEQGVRLRNDRLSILNAIKLYLEEIEASHSKLGMTEAKTVTLSAPKDDAMTKDDADDDVKQSTSNGENLTAECVVCMEENCAVVFVPCGHLCCCVKCSDSIEQLCPMCRGSIERKIRVIQS